MKTAHKIELNGFNPEGHETSWVSLWASFFGTKEIPSNYGDSGAECTYVENAFLSVAPRHIAYESVALWSGGERCYSKVFVDKKRRALFFSGETHGVRLLIPSSMQSDITLFKSACFSAPRVKEEKKPHIYIPVAEAGQLRLRRFNIELKQTGNILDYYNEDFPLVHERLMSRLSEDGGRGVAILHGSPGTGKTSYIRYLTGQFDNKRVVYIPQDLAGWLATPEAMKFLMDIPNSILIIEDAEEMLRPRKSGRGQSAVSTLLNMTDGLLADCLSIQVVCTFNDALSSIDAALLRPGRLIAQYEFKPLTHTRATELAKRDNLPIPMHDCTLAELYAEAPISMRKEREIGFKATAVNGPDMVYYSR